MSLSDIDLASLIDIYSRDDCVAVFRSQVAECLRELQSLRASQAKVVEALREIDEIAMKNGVEDLAMGDLLDDMDAIARFCESALAEKHGEKG
jgi:hypothetical protein